jgi:hypothetical protein
MDTSFTALMALVRETVADPRASARRIMAADIPMAARWQALALVVVLSVLLGQISVWLMTGGTGAMGGLMASPLQAGMVQGGVLLTMVFLTYHVGRAMGGQGSFANALLLITWLQAIMLLVQLVQLVALVVLPPFAGLLSVMGMVLFLWLLTSFVAELHGFESLGRVFGMILVTAIGLGFIATVFLSVLGFAPPEMG